VTAKAEYEASLRRAFVDGKADYIYITSKRQRFLLECAGYGITQGWLTEKLHEPDDQTAVLVYRLTPEGEKYFGVTQ